MHLVVDKPNGKLTVLEMDGRLMQDTVELESRIARLLLKVAYNTPNGTVEYGTVETRVVT
jgi:hypothetical protein